MNAVISPPSSVPGPRSSADKVSRVLTDFTKWLDGYGEKSWDFQSFFAGPVGGRAKALYYRHKLIGTAAVAPMIFCEAFLPAARRLFHHPMRFPIADAHYAMGFAFLYELTALRAGGSTKPEADLSPSCSSLRAGSRHLERAVHFLNELVVSRCPGFKEFCWGYPFDWVWHGGTAKGQTPLITTTPYCYEAFLQVAELLESEDRGRTTDDGLQPPARQGYGAPGTTEDGRPATAGKLRTKDKGCGHLSSVVSLPECKRVLESIARHAAFDIKDFPTSEKASSCSYSPFGEGGVINAAAYRAFLLTSASRVLSNDDYWRVAERNLNFVLENQNDDGSWYYAVDGVRDFIDHFHTCFVMKALAKVHTITGHEGSLEALSRGVDYYLANLFAEDGMPKPFAKAPRLTVYKRELYDCAECINSCLLLRDRFPDLESKLETVVRGILKDWIKPDGSFRSRRLHLGWDNLPMHRWGQSQMFRALAFYLRETLRPEVSDQRQRTEDRGRKTDGGRQGREGGGRMTEVQIETVK